jgi:hypothetical protein
MAGAREPTILQNNGWDIATKWIDTQQNPSTIIYAIFD